jgi:hypothetical protein
VKRAIWRLYLNFEKEEKWLNEMATAGWMLTDYSWCRYVFEEGREGEYVYRIELLKNLPTYPLSQKYLRFLEEAGIEYVAYYARWVYLRKKNRRRSVRPLYRFGVEDRALPTRLALLARVRRDRNDDRPFLLRARTERLVARRRSIV